MVRRSSAGHGELTVRSVDSKRWHGGLVARGGAGSILGLSLLSLLLAVVACGVPTSGDPPDDWRGFRGPHGLGQSSAQNLPVEWSVPGPGLRWSAPVPGVGNSQPVVADGRVYLTTAEREAEGADPWRVVLAYDAVSGEQLWRRELFQAPAEKRSPHNTLAGPSPVTDGETVWVYFGSHLAALDRDGNVRWQREIDPSYAEFSRYGAASSPVLTSTDVIVFQDREYARNEDIGFLAAFDRVTGDERWRTEWQNTCCAYSTPLVVDTGGVDRGVGEELWVSHSGSLTSYSAATGEVLWQHEVPINQVVAGAVYEPVEEAGEDSWLVVLASGADHVRASVGLRLRGHGAETTIEQLWLDKAMAPQSSSPILRDGLLYVLTLQGVVVCRDAGSGEILWRGRLSRGRNLAALVLGDGKLYATSASGMVSVVALGREFQLLAENELDEPGSTASPALGAGCFLQRGETRLYCFHSP